MTAPEPPVELEPAIHVAVDVLVDSDDAPEADEVPPESSESVVTPPPSTGEPRVDAAIRRLADLDTTPVTDHVAIVDEAHRLLQDALADLDEG